MSDDLRLAVALNGYGLERWDIDGIDRDVMPWEDVRELAVLTERLGFRALFLPQHDAWDPTTALAAIAGQTSRLALATGVLPLAAHHPRELVLAALTLQAVSGGRCILGVGSDLSLDETREQVAGIRDALHGGVGYLHERTWVLGPPDLPTDPPVPLCLAALGPRMLHLAGEVADGAILNWCTPERVADARSTLPDGSTIAVYVRTCLSHVDEHALEALQVATARYIHLGPYAAQLERMGLGPEARAAGEALDRGAHPREAVPEALVDRLCVRGRPEVALGRLREFRDAGADLVVVYPVPAGDAFSSISGTLMAVAPSPSGA